MPLILKCSRKVNNYRNVRLLSVQPLVILHSVIFRVIHISIIDFGFVNSYFVLLMLLIGSTLTVNNSHKVIFYKDLR